MARDMKAEAEAVLTRAICTQGDLHLKCAFPDCSCVVSPGQARAGLPALLALLDQRGWQIVPVLATPEMERFVNSECDTPDAELGWSWQAWLAHAPTPFPEPTDGQ
jgi:hypothetical protein